MTVLAFSLQGAIAFWLLIVYLLSAIVASYLSERKGYGDKAGLASGLILTFVGAIIWLFVPAKADSAWKRLGPFGTTPKRTASKA